jgi:hypothetical protein
MVDQRCNVSSNTANRAEDAMSNQKVNTTNMNQTLVTWLAALSISETSVQAVVGYLCNEDNQCSCVEDVRDLVEDEDEMNAVLALIPKAKKKRFQQLLQVRIIIH